MEDPKSITKGEQTQQAIIEAARDLFLQHGFHGTSMRQIADRAELALGGIYNYFASKEELFAAVLDAYHPYRVVFPLLDTVQGETVEEYVRAVAEKARGTVQGSQQMMPLVFIELVEFQGRHLKQLAEKLLPRLTEFMGKFATLQGQMRPLPLPVKARVLVSMFIGFMITDMVMRNTPFTDNQQHDWYGGLIDIYLHGILKPEA